MRSSAPGRRPPGALVLLSSVSAYADLLMAGRSGQDVIGTPALYEREWDVTRKLYRLAESYTPVTKTGVETYGMGQIRLMLSAICGPEYCLDVRQGHYALQEFLGYVGNAVKCGEEAVMEAMSVSGPLASFGMSLMRRQARILHIRTAMGATRLMTQLKSAGQGVKVHSGVSQAGMEYLRSKTEVPPKAFNKKPSKLSGSPPSQLHSHHRVAQHQLLGVDKAYEAVESCVKTIFVDKCKRSDVHHMDVLFKSNMSRLLSDIDAVGSIFKESQGVDKNMQEFDGSNSQLRTSPLGRAMQLRAQHDTAMANNTISTWLELGKVNLGATNYIVSSLALESRLQSVADSIRLLASVSCLLGILTHPGRHTADLLEKCTGKKTEHGGQPITFFKFYCDAVLDAFIKSIRDSAPGNGKAFFDLLFKMPFLVDVDVDKIRAAYEDREWRNKQVYSFYKEPNTSDPVWTYEKANYRKVMRKEQPADRPHLYHAERAYID